jgi:hypothetical protein
LLLLLNSEAVGIKMFEYILPQRSFWNFWGPNPLLKSIQIQGPFITVYGRKTIGEELSRVINELQGEVIGSHNFQHFNIHDRENHHLFWATENPHFHYMMPEKGVEQGVADLITSIFQREIPAAREKDYKEFLASIESDRVSKGDQELPSFVKEKIAQYDKYSPFFLSLNRQELIQDILSKYGEYCNHPSNDRCRELIQMYVIGIVGPFVDSLFKNPRNAQTTKNCELLEPLEEILECLKKLQKEPLNAELFPQIQQLILKVDVAELVKLETPKFAYLFKDTTLADRLSFVSRFIQESLAPEKPKTIRPISASPSTDKISLFFHAVMSSPVKYGLLGLAIILVFRKSITASLSAKI